MHATDLGCVQDVCMSVCLSVHVHTLSASNYGKMVILQTITKNQFPYVIIIYLHCTISSCTYTCTYTCMLAHAHRQTDIHTAIIRSLRQFINTLVFLLSLSCGCEVYSLSPPLPLLTWSVCWWPPSIFAHPDRCPPSQLKHLSIIPPNSLNELQSCVCVYVYVHGLKYVGTQLLFVYIFSLPA